MFTSTNLQPAMRFHAATFAATDNSNHVTSWGTTADSLSQTTLFPPTSGEGGPDQGPAADSSIGGQAALRFANSPLLSQHAFSDFASASEWTAFFVYQPDGNTQSELPLFSHVIGGQRVQFYAHHGGNLLLEFGSPFTPYVAYSAQAVAGGYFGKPQLVTLITNGAGRMFINGSLVTSGATNTLTESASVNMMIGGNADNQFFTGLVADIVMFTR
jgi:hypothetical protein